MRAARNMSMMMQDPIGSLSPRTTIGDGHYFQFEDTTSVTAVTGHC